MALPKMDVPIGVVEWEVFVPEQYSARAIDGNMIEAKRYRAIPTSRGYRSRRIPPGVSRRDVAAADWRAATDRSAAACSTRAAATLPGVTVPIAVGRYQAFGRLRQRRLFTFSGVPHGDVVADHRACGIRQSNRHLPLRWQSRDAVDILMEVGQVTETITVTGESALVDVRRDIGAAIRAAVTECRQPPARAAGVLPIRVDVPRAGVSHSSSSRWWSAIEATVTLRYKRR